MAPKKVLLVSTSAGSMGGKATGLWISELAEPYYACTEAGLDVTIASIAGGAIPIDAGSLADAFFTADAKKFLHDAAAVGALTHSVKVDASMAGAYDAVVMCGGHGTCVDFHGAAAATLKSVIEGTHAAGKVVGALCHGPCSLVDCVKPDGSALVAGLEVTCFTNAEEEAVGATDWVKTYAKLPQDALPQDALAAKGATFKEGAPFSSTVAVSGTVITGQNPQSAEELGKAVVAALA